MSAISGELHTAMSMVAVLAETLRVVLGVLVLAASDLVFVLVLPAGLPKSARLLGRHDFLFGTHDGPEGTGWDNERRFRVGASNRVTSKLT